MCLNVEIVGVGNCPNGFNDPRDTLKWPIETVCIPVMREDDAKEVHTLRDGSILYRRANGTYFRGTPNLCRCLPGFSLVSTPLGECAIHSLLPGDPIYVVTQKGERVIESIAHIRQVPVPDDHFFLKVYLNDGRIFMASPLHPTTDGRPLQSLEIDDVVDGANVIMMDTIPSHSLITWDLLPTGDHPFYIINGVPLKSTIPFAFQ